MPDAEERRRDATLALADDVGRLEAAARGDAPLSLGAWRRGLERVREDVEALDAILKEMRYIGRWP